MMRRSFVCLGWARLRKERNRSKLECSGWFAESANMFHFSLWNLCIANLFVFFPDPRVRDWLFMANPFPMFGILAVYLYFILKWGPAFMKNRKPFNLNKIIIAYNIIQIVACARLVVQVNPFYIIQIFLFYHKYDVRFFSSVYTQRTVLA